MRTIQDTEAWQELPKQKEQTLGCINNCRSLGTCSLSFLSQSKTRLVLSQILILWLLWIGVSILPTFVRGWGLCRTICYWTWCWCRITCYWTVTPAGRMWDCSIALSNIQRKIKTMPGFGWYPGLKTLRRRWYRNSHSVQLGCSSVGRVLSIT